MQHYADALCVPLVDGETVLGAIHVYLDRAGSARADFDFAISLGQHHHRGADPRACANEL